MNVQPLSSNQSTNFRARMFDPEGKQIKRFNSFGNLFDLTVDQMAERPGSEKTDIYVKELISEKGSGMGYDNFARVEVRNPLFGAQEFVQNIHHETNTPLETYGEKLYHMDLLVRSGAKYLEDNALKLSIISQIKDAFNAKQFGELNPMNILNDMLKYCSKEHGFDKKRISDFERIAKDLQDKMFYEMAKKIK